MGSRWAFAVAVAGLGLAVAGCGSDEPRTARQFAAEADPVCKRGNDFATSITTPSDAGMIKDFTVKQADNAAKTADALAKLDSPDGDDAAAAEDLIAVFRAAADEARKVGPEVDKENFPGIEAAVKNTVDAFKATDAKARALGSAECGRGEATAMDRLAQTAAKSVKTSYVIKADAMCQARREATKHLKPAKSLAELASNLDLGIKEGEKLTAALRAIPRPSLDKQKLDDFFAAHDAYLAGARETRRIALAGGSIDGPLDELEALDLRGVAKGTDYGFKFCGTA